MRSRKEIAMQAASELWEEVREFLLIVVGLSAVIGFFGLSAVAYKHSPASAYALMAFLVFAAVGLRFKLQYDEVRARDLRERDLRERDR